MNVDTHFFKSSPTVPNSRYPVLIYRNAISGSPGDFEALLRSNGWFPDWYSRRGLYPKHHFHSDAHELIGFTRGAQRGRIGGEDGADVELERGDVVVVPAGVGHLGLAISDDLDVVGAYPMGYGIHDFRLCEEAEFAEALEKVLRVPIPAKDPLFGTTGPLREIWDKQVALG
ncbi:hypothetical protein FJ420_16275 [Mesorhizobium sp. B3-1-3]|uniref:hypothetical protein n=1 Tax=unclassified Mesorhizobium TaxID=325217 RepID=UPI00112BCC7D|nr:MULTISPECIES: hypothetical protein [unclassified Mesorhizobium]TPI61468.1 hypothetical protein FJ424_22155 [Mesorhizobium sp. B3-1-8]TPI70581.1 hypothetical protein FJ420_16275 [Mesorhizobium sp. B3-1-3]